MCILIIDGKGWKYGTLCYREHIWFDNSCFGRIKMGNLQTSQINHGTNHILQQTWVKCSQDV
jgi:hypothetical protein